MFKMRISGVVKGRIGKILVVLAYLLLFFLCTELFYRQSINYNGGYSSDLIDHIRFALDGNETNYSILLPVFKLLYHINGTTFYIAMLLSAMVCGTVYLTFRLINCFMPWLSDFLVQVLAFAVNLVAPFYIPALNSHRYLGLFSGTLWHNPTYIAMKLFAVAVLVVFFRIYLKKEKANIVAWILLHVFLCVVTIIKPNFVVAFAPAVAILALIDLIRKEIKWGKVIALACSFVPAALVLLFQYNVIFNNNDGAGIGFAFGYVIGHYADRPLAAIVQSIVFPVMVLAANIKSIQKDKAYLLSWVMWGIALLQYLCLIETGARMLHGNWGWGLHFATFLLFVASLNRLIQNLLELQQFKSSGKDGEPVLPAYSSASPAAVFRNIYYAITGLMFVLHFYFDIRWFWIIINGGHYI